MQLCVSQSKDALSTVSTRCSKVQAYKAEHHAINGCWRHALLVCITTYFSEASIADNVSRHACIGRLHLTAAQVRDISTYLIEVLGVSVLLLLPLVAELLNLPRQLPALPAAADSWMQQVHQHAAGPLKQHSPYSQARHVSLSQSILVMLLGHSDADARSAEQAQLRSLPLQALGLYGDAAEHQALQGLPAEQQLPQCCNQ